MTKEEINSIVLSPFAFQSFLLISKSNVENVGGMYTYQTWKQNKRACDLVSGIVSIVMIETIYVCMYELWETDCIILVMLQINEMSLYLQITLALCNMKINGKILPNNLSFWFSLSKMTLYKYKKNCQNRERYYGRKGKWPYILVLYIFFLLFEQKVFIFILYLALQIM